VRVLLVDEGQTHDVFEVVDATEAVVHARSPYLFEVGEELRVRVERDGKAAHETTARVRAHHGGVSELELGEPPP
jgi:hypothetical protein